MPFLVSYAVRDLTIFAFAEGLTAKNLSSAHPEGTNNDLIFTHRQGWTRGRGVGLLDFRYFYQQ